MKIKEMVGKIELFHIVISVFIMLTIFFVYYQYSSTIPKKVNIQIDETKELEQSNFQIEDINVKKKQITCKIDEKYIPEKEYNNYVIGKGTARKINCSIIMKVEDKYYKIKTLSQGTVDNKIVLTGAVRTNYLLENYEIMLYDEGEHILYKYVGGQSE